MYEKNLQGDVLNVISPMGQVVVSYSYDEWGRLLSVTGSMASTLGAVNSLRYRGYLYDTKTSLYYLNTRYYDPEVTRFINGDGVLPGTGESVLGYNLYVYCFNNPICLDDQGGNWPSWLKKAAAAVAVVAVVAVATVVTVYTAGAGAALGAAAVGAVIGVVGKYVEDVSYNISTGKKGLEALKPSSTWQDYASSGISGAVTGMLNVAAPGAGKLAKNGVDAVLKPGIKQSLDIATGKEDVFKTSDFLLDSTTRFITSSTLKFSGSPTSFSGINKIVGSLPCSTARGPAKQLKDYLKSKNLLPVF